MDSRMVGHAQRRRIGAPADVYDPEYAEFDSAEQVTLGGTRSRLENPQAHIDAANDKIARLKGMQPGTNFGVDHQGAQHKIIATRPGPDTSSAGERSGVIMSVPVSTDYKAIQAAFENRTKGGRLKREQDEEGGFD